ncbi:MAG: hypothetical protein ACERKZ_05580 [Lachnotalea sp.]
MRKIFGILMGLFLILLLLSCLSSFVIYIATVSPIVIFFVVLIVMYNEGIIR